MTRLHSKALMLHPRALVALPALPLVAATPRSFALRSCLAPGQFDHSGAATLHTIIPLRYTVLSPLLFNHVIHALPIIAGRDAIGRHSGRCSMGHARSARTGTSKNMVKGGCGRFFDEFSSALCGLRMSSNFISSAESFYLVSLALLCSAELSRVRSNGAISSSGLPPALSLSLEATARLEAVSYVSVVYADLWRLLGFTWQSASRGCF